MYVCGPTVYQPIHVGNARPFVVFNWLKRFLTSVGVETTLVMNVTDVNDKIYAAALAQGLPSRELSDRMTARYQTDTDRLGLGRPDVEPTVTGSIPEIVALVEALIERGHAYAVDGDVYFDVAADARYGELSGRDPSEADQGEGLEGAARKRAAADFALWKAAKPGEDASWESPWGLGRPAWHIECSAMGECHLGAEFEIHGGGLDLAFPHHENEAAQTRCGSGHDLARLWLHSGMLQIGDEKMGKSRGNAAPLSDVLDQWGAHVLLYFFATAHYRQPLSFSDDALTNAQTRIERLIETGRSLAPGESPEALCPHREAFFAALANDFNTPVALAAIAAWSKAANGLPRGSVGDADLRLMLGVLGLEALLDATPDGTAVSDEAQAILAQRTEARANRDWASADVARDRLLALGWTVRDGAAGPELFPATATE
jgi:cysteinyl-tRNA synthetase